MVLKYGPLCHVSYYQYWVNCRVIPSVGNIPMVLMVRMIAASIPVLILRRRREFSPRVIRILTWGGLRGGISVALVLSLEPGLARDVFLTMTYLIVIFSIAVQGLTLKYLIRPITESPAADEA